MLTLRRALVTVFGFALATAVPIAAAIADQPQLGKPRPAPPAPPNSMPLPPANFDPSLAIGGQDVNARKIQTRLSVDVSVNDRGPYRFIVDSGADTSVVGLNIARELQLPIATPVTLNAMTARNVVDRVRVDRLKVGNSTFRSLQLPALKEIDLGSDGIIGIDALVEQRLMMDFEQRAIKVEDGRVPYKAAPGEIVVVAKRRRGQLILTRVRAERLPLDAVIDTGSEVTIGNFILRDRLRRRFKDKLITVTVRGVTGADATLEMGVISELQLGPVILHDVPVAFAEVPPFKLFGLSREPALLLGTDLLESFRRVSLDFHARRVRFQLRKCDSQGIIVHTAPDARVRLSSTGTADVCGR